MTTFRIYRGIALNEGETINTDALGCSWSLDEVYASNHGKMIADARNKDGYVLIYADINESVIDWSNTLYAMETRNNEFEVVLNGSEITAKVYYSELDSIESGEVFTGQSASESDFEDYCNSYDGDVTKENFISLANEF
jgi:hypothetical protein